MKKITFLLLCGFFFPFRGFGFSIINPSAQVGLRDCYSAKTMGFSRLRFSLMGNLSYDPNFLLEIPENSLPTRSIKPFVIMYDFYPAMGGGITDFLDFSIVQPFYFDIIEGLIPNGGLGDFKIVLKTRIPGNTDRIVDGALISELSFGTGSRSSGFFPRHIYNLNETEESLEENSSVKSLYPYTAKNTVWSLLLSGTVGVKKFFFHLNFGGAIKLGGKNLNENAIIFNTGAEYVPTERIGFFIDAHSEPTIYNLVNNFNPGSAPFHLSEGISLRAANGATLVIGSTHTLTNNNERSYYTKYKKSGIYKTKIEPEWKFFVQFGWDGFILSSDKDKDMIRDRDDLCPQLAEDIDGFKDLDGCPDYDNDEDGIDDKKDQCPNLPEDQDGYRDEDGCPDPDNDNDLIPDSLDRCPNSPEDRDGFEDLDGCPDYDNDKDGIPDSLDRCINLPEDIDGFEDNDGCPDLDNDNDGVLDSLDMCPDSAGILEKKGCPEPKEKAKEIPYGRVILPNVTFEGGSTELSSGSEAELDRVYHSLVDWPEVKIEIQVHTDNTLPPKKALDLSKKRAEVIYNYFIQKGISEERLRATGKGSEDPIADNSTIYGRRLNNRVELRRIDEK